MDTAQDTALQYIIQHENQHLDSDKDLLIERTTIHLIQVHGISRTTAYAVTCQAWADRDAAKQGSNAAYIDMQRTTRNVVFLNQPGRSEPIVISPAQLMAWVS